MSRQYQLITTWSRIRFARLASERRAGFDSFSASLGKYFTSEEEEEANKCNDGIFSFGQQLQIQLTRHYLQLRVKV